MNKFPSSTSWIFDVINFAEPDGFDFPDFSFVVLVAFCVSDAAFGAT